MPHSFWWLAVDALAVYRLSILATRDTITAPVREHIRQHGWIDQTDGMPIQVGTLEGRTARTLFELAGCPWCVSVWFAAGAVMLTRLTPTAWQYVAFALACSAVAGFLADR